MAKSMRQIAVAELDADDDPPPEKKRGRKVVLFDMPTHDDSDLEQDDDQQDDPPPRKSTKAKRVELVDVDLGGKKFKIDKNALAEIEKLRGDAGASKGLLEEVRALTENLKGSKPKGKKKEEEQADEGDDDVPEGAELEMFTDPKGFLKKFADKLRKKITKELTNNYRADQSSKDFWGSFYGEYPELKQYKKQVEAVLEDKMREIGNLSVEEGMKKLADYTRAELLKIAKQFGRAPTRKDHTEGGGSNRSQQDEEETDQEEEDDNIPKTLSALLKQRKKNRLRASQQTEE